MVDGISYDVNVDILAGMYGGTQRKRRSQHVQGVKALKATGGNFAFEFPAQKISVEAERSERRKKLQYKMNKVSIKAECLCIKADKEYKRRIAQALEDGGFGNRKK